MNNKLKILKSPLRTWSREKFADVDIKIKNLESVVHELDLASENRTLNSLEMARLKATQSHLQTWLIRRERIWRQRARSYGFSLKDHNSKFFHASTTIRRKRNEIINLNINGRMVHGVVELTSELRDYFVKRFAQGSTLDFDFDLGNHVIISEE